MREYRSYFLSQSPYIQNMNCKIIYKIQTYPEEIKFLLTLHFMYTQ